MSLFVDAEIRVTPTCNQQVNALRHQCEKRKCPPLLSIISPSGLQKTVSDRRSATYISLTAALYRQRIFRQSSMRYALNRQQTRHGSMQMRRKGRASQVSMPSSVHIIHGCFSAGILFRLWSPNARHMNVWSPYMR